jgi:hypothetical protein
VIEFEKLIAAMRTNERYDVSLSVFIKKFDDVVLKPLDLYVAEGTSAFYDELRGYVVSGLIIKLGYEYSKDNDVTSFSPESKWNHSGGIDWKRLNVESADDPLVKLFLETYDDKEVTVGQLQYWIISVGFDVDTSNHGSLWIVETLLHNWAIYTRELKLSDKDYRDTMITMITNLEPQAPLEWMKYADSATWYVLRDVTGVNNRHGVTDEDAPHQPRYADLFQSQQAVERPADRIAKKPDEKEKHPDIPHGGMLHPREKKYVPELEIESNVMRCDASLLRRIICNIIKEEKIKR